ncbi:helix-turn-helix domain-containing protein [Telluribacter sp. SYSU D00476]|uniref:helix-turn-helix domain-containing protein n=1 Tax=Telluribacter sp. SYSU D00476 TaxID=2811430 RepID=UPI001FF3DCDB|nr:helix-turn-helix domain-containing protein [Telluribacter sp. SYSU D00476]
MTKLVLIEFEEFKAFAGNLIQEEIRKALYPNGQSDTPKQEPFLTRAQMAKELDASLVTLHQWQKDGLPYHRLHRRIYFIKSEVLEYMHSNQKKKKKG